MRDALTWANKTPQGKPNSRCHSISTLWARRPWAERSASK
jgi:hypothetical protein